MMSCTVMVLVPWRSASPTHLSATFSRPGTVNGVSSCTTFSWNAPDAVTTFMTDPGS